MAKELEDIFREAAEVRDETIAEHNTAQRVGGVLTELVSLIGRAIVAGDITVEKTLEGFNLVWKLYEDDGKPVTHRLEMPRATSTSGGLMGAEDKYLLDLLGRNHIDLGTFNSGRSAEAAAATYDVVGNKDINVITYGVNKNNLVYRAIIINQYNEARNLQYLFYDGNRYTRYIDKNGGAVSTIQPWQKDGARNINYDSSARELSLTTMHGDVVGAKVVLPLASSSDAGLMSSSDKAALASLAKYIRYTPSNRILALQNEAKSNISTVILPIASTEEPGLLSAADFTKLSNYPTKLVKDLGLMSSTDAGDAEAAKSEIAGDRSISLIRYTTQGVSAVKVTTIFQWCNGINEVAQIKFVDKAQWRRNVTGATGVAGATTTPTMWERTGAHYLGYDSATRKIQLKDYTQTVFRDVQLPLASSSDAGLMSSSDKAALALRAQYIRYTASNRILALQNEAKSNISTVILPIASTEEPGLLSAADFTKLSNYPTKLVKDLGLMSSTDAGDAEAAKSEIAGDRSISLIRYTTQGVSAVKVTTIFQWCNGINEVAQIKFVDKAQWRRNVTGATGVAGATTTPTMWERTGAHYLGYDSATRKIQLKDYTQTVFRDVQLPLASSSDAGLMSPSDKEKLDQSGENIIEGIDILSITTTQQVDSQYSGVTKLSNAFSNLNKRLVFSYDNVHDGCSYSITPVFRAKTIIGGSGEAAYTFKLAFVSPTDGSTIIQLWEARDGISCWQVTVEIL